MGATLDNIIASGLIILLVFTALAFGTVEPWSLALFELTTVCLVVLWAGKAVFEGQLAMIIPPITWPLLALLLFGLVQSVAVTGADGRLKALSLDVEATRLTVLTLFCLIVAMLLFANFLVKRGRVELVGQFLIYYVCAFSVFGLAQHFSWNGKFYWTVAPTVPLSAPFGSFVNHAHFSGYVEMVMPLPLALLLLKAVRREAQLFFGFAAVVMGVATVVSLSRGGMVSMLGGLAFTSLMSLWAIRQRRGKEPGQESAASRFLLSRIGLGALIPVVILAGIFWVGVDPVLDRLEKSTLAGEEKPGQQTLYSARGFIWVDTLKLIADYPLLGTGLGTYATAFARYTQNDSAYTPIEQSHNDYLQILADAGLVGGGLALWFLVSLFRSFARGIKHADPVLAALVLGAGGGIFALLVHSFFDFNLQIPANSLLFLLLAAIVSVLGTPARSQNRLNHQTSAPPPRALSRHSSTSPKGGYPNEAVHVQR
jgi:O-antigen ligase